MITTILATTRTGGMSFNGGLPWSSIQQLKPLADMDMQIFRDYTDGKICVMGRNTYESIRRDRTDSDPLLPNRRTWILSSTSPKNLSGADAQFISMDVLKLALDNLPAEQEVIICGGKKLYEEFLPITDKIIWNCFAFECPYDVKWDLGPNQLEQRGFVLKQKILHNQFLGTAIFYNSNTQAIW